MLLFKKKIIEKWLIDDQFGTFSKYFRKENVQSPEKLHWQCCFKILVLNKQYKVAHDLLVRSGLVNKDSGVFGVQFLMKFSFLFLRTILWLDIYVDIPVKLYTCIVYVWIGLLMISALCTTFSDLITSIFKFQCTLNSQNWAYHSFTVETRFNGSKL